MWKFPCVRYLCSCWELLLQVSRNFWSKYFEVYLHSCDWITDKFVYKLCHKKWSCRSRNGLTWHFTWYIDRIMWKLWQNKPKTQKNYKIIKSKHKSWKVFSKWFITYFFLFEKKFIRPFRLKNQKEKQGRLWSLWKFGRITNKTVNYHQKHCRSRRLRNR